MEIAKPKCEIGFSLGAKLYLIYRSKIIRRSHAAQRASSRLTKSGVIMKTIMVRGGEVNIKTMSTEVKYSGVAS